MNINATQTLFAHSKPQNQPLLIITCTEKTHAYQKFLVEKFVTWDIDTGKGDEKEHYVNLTLKFDGTWFMFFPENNLRFSEHIDIMTHRELLSWMAQNT